MRNIVILNSLHFSYPLPILMRVSYNTLIVKQNTSDYYKYTKKGAQMRSFLIVFQFLLTQFAYQFFGSNRLLFAGFHILQGYFAFVHFIFSNQSNKRYHL